MAFNTEPKPTAKAKKTKKSTVLIYSEKQEESGTV